MNTHSGSALFAVDRLVDVFFIMDIIFNFITGYTTTGKVIMDPVKIAKCYSRTWLAPDVVASVPFDLFIASDVASGRQAAYRSTKFVRIMKLIRLVKLFRMLRLNRILNRLERKMTIKYGLWQVIKFAFAVMCLAHWQACAWYLMHVLQNHGEGGITWVELLATNTGGRPLDEVPRWSQYITCIYWAVTTMTTIGYGDIVPSNTEERIVTLIAELVGSSVFLYGLTQVTSLIANINTADVEFHKLMDQANEYFEFRNIPTPLRVKVREFFHYKRASSLFHAEHRLLDHLSDNIRQEMQLWSMRNVLNATPFLRDANESFVKMIVDKLVRKVFSPREIVIQQGEIGDEMYFIAHGEVEVIAGGHRVAYLGEGSMIGEIAMAMKTRRTATVRTVTFTELLSLSRRVFQHAARAVPETAEAMVGYAVKRLRVALWKRVKQKVTFITACNAFRTSIGLETIGTVRENSLRGAKSLRGLAGGGGLGSPLRTVRSFRNLAGGGGGGGGGAGGAAGAAKGDAPGLVRSASKENLFVSPTEFFELGMESVQVPYLEEDETNSKAKKKYIKQEVHHASSVMSIAAFATQQMLQRLDNPALDVNDVTHGSRSMEAECDATTDELITLLHRLGTHLELAAERVSTGRKRQSRRSLPGTGL